MRGVECVWDYPRPPRLERTDRHLRVIFAGRVLADSRSAWRVLETSHPPVYYLPPRDVEMQYLEKSPHASFCEWKGKAAYYDVLLGSRRAVRRRADDATTGGAVAASRARGGRSALCAIGGADV